MILHPKSIFFIYSVLCVWAQYLPFWKHYLWKTTFNGRRPLMGDNLLWRATLDGRWPSMEDDLRWKTTFDGRQPSMEESLRWKTTYDGGRTSKADDRWWKTICDGRCPSMEDDQWWRTTFIGGISRFHSAIYRRCSHFYLAETILTKDGNAYVVEKSTSVVD